MPREWRSPLKFQVGVALFDATGAAVAVELVEAFLPADLDVFGEAARGQPGVAFDDGLDDCGVLRVDMLELSDAVTEAAHLEDADQQTGFVNDLANARIEGERHQQRMESAVGSDEAPHRLGVKALLTGGMQLVDQAEDAVRELFESPEVFGRKLLAGNLGDDVDFEGFTQLV
jgi:hypothetical protein